MIKGVLRDHLGLAESVLAESVFPDSAAVKPMKGLVGYALVPPALSASSREP